MAEDAVLLDRDGAVALLTLNRPEEMNAWSPAIEDAYFAHLDALEGDPEVRAVVVTGSGRAFCAGAGIADLGEDPASVVDRPRPRSRPYFFAKPLVAALNGATAGLGLIEALYCDIRFCSAEAKLTTSFARRGLIAEYGVAWLLQRQVGVSRARDLMISGRVLRGEEAAAIGLVEHALPAEEVLPAALAYARDLAENCSPTSIAVIKAQLHNSLDASFEEAFGEAEDRLRTALAGADFKEGIESFVERRPPAFAPLSAD
jgi:enoyl-CoA hydratase/carnithine racemase